MNRIALGLLIGVGVCVLTFVVFRPPPQDVTVIPQPPAPPPTLPASLPEPPTPASPPPAVLVGVPLVSLAPPPPAAAITPDGRQVVVGLTEKKDEACVFSGLVWRDLQTGVEVKRLDLRKTLDPDNPEAGSYAHCAEGVAFRRLIFLPDGQLLIGGGQLRRTYFNPHPLYCESRYITSALGCLWLIAPDTGKVEKVLLRGGMNLVSDIELTRDGAKLLVRTPLPPRGYEPEDPPFVEVRQWDTATWERDWVKVLDPTEAAKLLEAK